MNWKKVNYSFSKLYFSWCFRVFFPPVICCFQKDLSKGCCQCYREKDSRTGDSTSHTLSLMLSPQLYTQATMVPTHSLWSPPKCFLSAYGGAWRQRRRHRRVFLLLPKLGIIQGVRQRPQSERTEWPVIVAQDSDPKGLASITDKVIPLLSSCTNCTLVIPLYWVMGTLQRWIHGCLWVKESHQRCDTTDLFMRGSTLSPGLGWDIQPPINTSVTHISSRFAHPHTARKVIQGNTGQLFLWLSLFRSNPVREIMRSNSVHSLRGLKRKIHSLMMRDLP